MYYLMYKNKYDYTIYKRKRQYHLPDSDKLTGDILKLDLLSRFQSFSMFYNSLFMLTNYIYKRNIFKIIPNIWDISKQNILCDYESFKAWL